MPAQATINSSDLDPLVGEKWIGKLTYLDYSTNQPTTILADLVVSKTTEQERLWFFAYQYPKEPHANSYSTLDLCRNGTKIAGETVIEKTNLPNNVLKLVTQKKHKRKQYRYTYLISNTAFSIQKEERNHNDTTFFERNRYEFTRP